MVRTPDSSTFTRVSSGVGAAAADENFKPELLSVREKARAIYT